MFAHLRITQSATSHATYKGCKQQKATQKYNTSICIMAYKSKIKEKDKL